MTNSAHSNSVSVDKSNIRLPEFIADRANYYVWWGVLIYGVLIIKPWQIAASVYLHQNQEIRQVLIKEVWLCPMDMQCMLSMKCNCLCLSLKHHRALEAHLYLYFKWSYKFLTCVNMYVMFTCLRWEGGRGHKSLEQAVSAHWASLLASTLNWITLVWETCGCNIWCWGNNRLRNKICNLIVSVKRKQKSISWKIFSLRENPFGANKYFDFVDSILSVQL